MLIRKLPLEYNYMYEIWHSNFDCWVRLSNYFSTLLNQKNTMVHSANKESSPKPVHDSALGMSPPQVRLHPSPPHLLTN